jgi:uncharacterized protein YegL/preprotein translocase subunit YajC
MKKRGISNVITTMTLILLAILAIMLIALIIYFIIRNQTEISEAKQKLLTQDVNIGNITFSGTDVNITVARGATRQVVINLTQKQTPTYADIVIVTDLSASMSAYNYTFPYVNYNCTLGNEDKNICIYNQINQTCGFYEPYTLNPAHGLTYINAANYSCEHRILNKSLCESCGGDTFYNRKFHEVVDANIALITQVLNNPDPKKAEGKRIGIVGYNNTANEKWTSPLTSNSQTLIDKIYDSWYVSGSTCICCGINSAIQELDANSNSEFTYIILMTDGVPVQNCTANHPITDAAKEDSYDAARIASSNGIKVYTVGLGADINENLLTTMASLGGGKYYYANVGELVSTFTRVLTEIEKNYASQKTDHLIVVFYNATESRTVTIENPPNNPFESSTYQVTLNPALTNIIRVEIYPVVVTPSGQKVVADNAVDSWSVEV